jgi:hypothetical protein
LCPKGSASKQLVTGPQQLQKVRYRAPYGTDWQDLDLDTAMDMVADRVLDARSNGWQDFDADRNTLRRTMAIATASADTSTTPSRRSWQQPRGRSHVAAWTMLPGSWRGRPLRPVTVPALHRFRGAQPVRSRRLR